MTPYRNPTPTTDAILEYKLGGKLGLVLIERGKAPFGLAFPGGFHEEGLSGEENTIKEVLEETGLHAFTDVTDRPFRSPTSPSRDPRRHNISNVYIMRGFGQLKAGDDAKGAAHYSFDEVRGLIGQGRLAFDHAVVLAQYLDHPEQRTTKKHWTLGIIGRFKPLHLGAASLLEQMCAQADKVVIGVGSANQHNVYNPFTAGQTIGMIDAQLKLAHSNYDLFELPDYFDDKNWTAAALDRFKGVDVIVTGNGLVKELLEPHFQMLAPEELVSPGSAGYNGTAVRLAMAKNEGWEKMVPEEVAGYMKRQGLVGAFRRDFGQETIATFNGASSKTINDERNKIAAMRRKQKGDLK